MKPNPEGTYNQGQRKARLQDSASPAIPLVETDDARNQHQSYIDERNPRFPLARKLYSMLPPYVDHERGKTAQQSQHNNSI